MGRPVISHQTDVGGGIWRIKWGKPARRRLLALACMHEGAAVLRLPEKGGEEHGVEMVTRYKGHESMAYGIDWCQQDEEEEEAVLASCSFYDHAAHLWSVKTDG